MAVIPKTKYHLAVTSNSIYIDAFWVPFDKSEHLTVKKNSTVAVSFDGAMGLNEKVTIEFELITAEKVAEFIQALLVKTRVRLVPNSPPTRVLYTISPTVMTKIGRPETDEEIEWDHLNYIYWELSERFPKIKAAFIFFLDAYQYLDENRQLGFPYHVEILRNAHKSITKVLSEPEVARMFTALGGRLLSKPS
jgi:hypothetical protein